jgi:putative transposase
VTFVSPVRGSICLARQIPEGKRYRALKAEAEVVEGDLNDLLWDLAVHRHALQRVVDALWELDKLPNRSQAHQMFYAMLRSYGLRAHVARNVYEQALALVKASRENDRSRPTIRKLSARLDYQDAKVDMGKGLIDVALRDKRYLLRLKQRREYVAKFLGLRWKEVHLKCVRGRLLVSVVFEFGYRPYAPRGLMALDVNLRKVATFDGCDTRRHETRFSEALSKRARAEELQKKYPKRWKYNERILKRIRSLYRKAKNVVIDRCWKLAREVVFKASKRKCAIVLEDLEGLREGINERSRRTRWELELFAYRKLQHSIVSKALEHKVLVILVEPKHTSSLCPKCDRKLKYVDRLAICRCGFKGDRDCVGAMNIWFKALSWMASQFASAGARGGSLLSAPPVNDEAGGRGRTRDEGMRHVHRTILHLITSVYRTRTLSPPLRP